MRSDNGRKRTTGGSCGSPQVERGRMRRRIAQAPRYNLFALVEARGKADEAESQLEELRETLEGWKRRFQDIVDEAETQVRAATADAQFWNDRYIKLAWLANLALMNIPRRLRAAEDMVEPTRTPREIKEFLEQCRKLYDRMKELSAPP
ncbi:hypothetical protein CR513_05157, partial [Mucuna pruriens]